MTHTSAFLAFAVVAMGALSGPAGAQLPDAMRAPSAAVRAHEALGKLPLYFVENQGQVDPRVAYYLQGGDTTVYFTPEGLTIALTGPAAGPSRTSAGPGGGRQRWAVKLDFVGADVGTRPRGEEATPATVSYFKGARAQWRTGVGTYASLVYPGVWPGIDLVFAGTASRLKYTFLLHPGADPDRIKLAYRGASAVTLTGTGELDVSTPVGGFRDEAPYAYQEVDGRRVEVAAAYAMAPATPGVRGYGFTLGPYDKAAPLVLDPAMFVYSGYAGGLGNESGRAIAVDGAGNAYVTGETTSSEATFPETVGPDLSFNGATDAFVAKVNAAGTALVYAGYVGGSGLDQGLGIAVDGAGNASVTGVTGSSEAAGFPVTGGPDVTHNGNEDAFVARVNAAGTALLYAGYIGAISNDQGRAIAVDGSGNAYVAGLTSCFVPFGPPFPVLVGPDLTCGGSSDVFVAKVNAAGTLVYSGYVGGSSTDNGFGIAVDGAGSAYVTGDTVSPDFPVTVGPAYNGQGDVFVAKVNTAGTGFVYARYLFGAGGGQTQSNAIAVDRFGNAYVAGVTASQSLPVTVGSDLTAAGGGDAFVAKLNAAGAALVYAGYIGGALFDRANGIAVDNAGNASVVGETQSSEAQSFPVSGGPDLTFNGGSSDAFVAKVKADGTGILYAGYIGGAGSDQGFGIALDGFGSAYVTGITNSLSAATFPVIVGPDLTFNGGTSDAFVAKIAEEPIADAGPDQTVDEGTQVTLDGSGSSGASLTYHWSQVAGSPVSLNVTDPVHPTFVAPQVPVGGETLTFQLVVNDGQQSSQPDQVDITVKNVNTVPVCDAGAAQTVNEGGAVTLDGSGSYDPDGDPLTYAWTQVSGPAVVLSDPASAMPTFTAPVVGPAGETLGFDLAVNDGTAGTTCGTTVQVIDVNQKPVADAGPDQTKNEGTPVSLDGTGSTDPDGDPLTYAWTQVSGTAVALSGADTAMPSFTAPAVEPGGEALVFQLVVNDGQLASDPDTVEITVLNVNDPPVCSLAQASPASLWPPNHGMEAVSITNVADSNDDQVVVTVTGVTQDEPVTGSHGGDTSPDAIIQGNTVLLRTERSAPGNGRVYEVHFTADDGQGGTCSGVARVQVPSTKKGTAVDDGQLHDSTLP